MIKLAICPAQLLQTSSAYYYVIIYYMHAQYYANEVCKSCASLAGLLSSFIVDVIGFKVSLVF